MVVTIALHNVTKSQLIFKQTIIAHIHLVPDLAVPKGYWYLEIIDCSKFQTVVDLGNTMDLM